MDFSKKLKITFTKNFSFTPEERIILLYLCAAFVFGIILHLNLYKERNANAGQRYDYSAFDSEFGDINGRPVQTTPADTAGLSVINKMTAADFEKLRSIGPIISQRIIDYRTLNGPFKTVDGLLEVSGIGPKRLEVIKVYLDNLSKN